MFAIAHDGFVQNARYATLEEVDEKGWAKRVVGYDELTA